MVASVTDAAGNTGTGSQVLTVDVTVPVLTIDGGAARSTSDTSPWTYGTTAEKAGTLVHVSVGGQFLTATVQPGGTWGVSAQTLAAGAYPVLASITDAAGNVGTMTQSLQIGTAATPPISTLNALPTTTMAAQVTLSWTRPIAAPAVTTFDLRVQSATPTTAFTDWRTAAAWTGRADTSVVSQTLAVGGTYCYSVRAHNLANQTGPWSPARCVTRPTDDRALTASAGWTRSLDSRFYASTLTSSTKAGASLTLSGAQVSRLTLLATRCPTCGTVGVYVGTARVGKIDLAATTTQRQVLFTMPLFSYRTGTVTVKVLSSGRTVQIDGLALSRT